MPLLVCFATSFSMRILTLVPGPDAVPDATRLWEEIRAFNRTVDFRLRFLHIAIEGTVAAPNDVAATLDPGEGLKVHPVAAKNPLEASATLAILLNQERPALLIISGVGPLCDAGVAAAKVAGIRVATFGAPRASHADALDLGDDARLAVERMSGVAREFG